MEVVETTVAQIKTERLLTIGPHGLSMIPAVTKKAATLVMLQPSALARVPTAWILRHLCCFQRRTHP